MKKLVLFSALFFGFFFSDNSAIIFTIDDTGNGGGTGTGSGTGTGTGSGSDTGILEKGGILLTTMVYPNPSSGDLYISSSVSGQLSDLKVYNINGALVYETTDKVQKIDLESFSSGVYYIQLTVNNTDKYLNKIIKVNR